MHTQSYRHRWPNLSDFLFPIFACGHSFMDFYVINLAILSCAIISCLCWRLRKNAHGIPSGVPEEQPQSIEELSDDDDTTFSAFRRRFLVVYVLAVAADWLQVCRSPCFSRLSLTSSGFVHVQCVQKQSEPRRTDRCCTFCGGLPEWRRQCDFHRRSCRSTRAETGMSGVLSALFDLMQLRSLQQSSDTFLGTNTGRH